jgi:hypothetical protein
MTDRCCNCGDFDQTSGNIAACETITQRRQPTRRLSKDHRRNSTWQCVSAELEQQAKRDDNDRPNEQRAPVDAARK